MWADPGQMTGFALYKTAVHEGGAWMPFDVPSFEAFELPFDRACQFAEHFCWKYADGLAIGWERFDINDTTHKKTQAGIKDAMHMIGVLRHLTAKYGCRFLGEANQHTPDKDEQASLKKLGWWMPGQDDAQSAACHMLRWLIRQNELTPAQRTLLYS
jgi:hypothetical protein